MPYRAAAGFYAGNKHKTSFLPNIIRSNSLCSQRFSVHIAKCLDDLPGLESSIRRIRVFSPN